MSVLLSEFVPPSPFLTVSTSPFSICLHLYSCLANRFISTIFLDFYIYVNIFLFSF